MSQKGSFQLTTSKATKIKTLALVKQNAIHGALLSSDSLRPEAIVHEADPEVAPIKSSDVQSADSLQKVPTAFSSGFGWLVDVSKKARNLFSPKGISDKVTSKSHLSNKESDTWKSIECSSRCSTTTEFFSPESEGANSKLSCSSGTLWSCSSDDLTSCCESESNLGNRSFRKLDTRPLGETVAIIQSAATKKLRMVRQESGHVLNSKTVSQEHTEKKIEGRPKNHSEQSSSDTLCSSVTNKNELVSDIGEVKGQIRLQEMDNYMKADSAMGMKTTFFEVVVDRPAHLELSQKYGAKSDDHDMERLAKVKPHSQRDEKHFGMDLKDFKSILSNANSNDQDMEKKDVKMQNLNGIHQLQLDKETGIKFNCHGTQQTSEKDTIKTLDQHKLQSDFASPTKEIDDNGKAYKAISKWTTSQRKGELLNGTMREMKQKMNRADDDSQSRIQVKIENEHNEELNALNGIQYGSKTPGPSFKHKDMIHQQIESKTGKGVVIIHEFQNRQKKSSAEKDEFDIQSLNTQNGLLQSQTIPNNKSEAALLHSEDWAVAIDHQIGVGTLLRDEGNLIFPTEELVKELQGTNELETPKNSRSIAVDGTKIDVVTQCLKENIIGLMGHSEGLTEISSESRHEYQVLTEDGNKEFKPETSSRILMESLSSSQIDFNIKCKGSSDIEKHIKNQIKNLVKMRKDEITKQSLEGDSNNLQNAIRKCSLNIVKAIQSLEFKIYKPTAVIINETSSATQIMSLERLEKSNVQHVKSSETVLGVLKEIPSAERTLVSAIGEKVKNQIIEICVGSKSPNLPLKTNDQQELDPKNGAVNRDEYGSQLSLEGKVKMESGLIEITQMSQTTQRLAATVDRRMEASLKVHGKIKLEDAFQNNVISEDKIKDNQSTIQKPPGPEAFLDIKIKQEELKDVSETTISSTVAFHQFEPSHKDVDGNERKLIKMEALHSKKIESKGDMAKLSDSELNFKSSLSFKTLDPQNKYLTKTQSDITCKSATKAEVKHDLEGDQPESVISLDEIARGTLKQYLSLPKSKSLKELQTKEVLEKSGNKLNGIDNSDAKLELKIKDDYRAIVNAGDKTISTVLEDLLILQESSNSREEPILDSGRIIKEVNKVSTHVKGEHWLTSASDAKDAGVIQEVLPVLFESPSLKTQQMHVDKTRKVSNNSIERTNFVHENTDKESNKDLAIKASSRQMPKVAGEPLTRNISKMSLKSLNDDVDISDKIKMSNYKQTAKPKKSKRNARSMDIIELSYPELCNSSYNLTEYPSNLKPEAMTTPRKFHSRIRFMDIAELSSPEGNTTLTDHHHTGLSDLRMEKEDTSMSSATLAHVKPLTPKNMVKNEQAVKTFNRISRWDEAPKRSEPYERPRGSWALQSRIYDKAQTNDRALSSTRSQPVFHQTSKGGIIEDDPNKKRSREFQGTKTPKESTEISEGEFKLPADLYDQRESLLKAGETKSEPEKSEAGSRSRESTRTPSKSSFEDDAKFWRYSDKIKVKDQQIESFVQSQTSLIDGSRSGSQIPLRPGKKDSAEWEKMNVGKGAKIQKAENSFHADNFTDSTEHSEGELPADFNKQRESLLKAGKIEREPEKSEAGSISRESTQTPRKSTFEEDAKSWRYSDKIKVKDNQIESLVPSQTSLIDGSRTGPQIPLSPAKKDSADLEKVHHIEHAKIGKPEPSFDEEDSAGSTEPSEGEFELPAALNKQRESLLKAGKTESDLEKRDADSRSRKSKRTPTKSPFEDDAKSWRYSDKIKVIDNQIESLVPSQTSLIDGSRTGPQIPLSQAKKDSADLENVHHIERAKIGKPEPSFDEEDSAESTEPSEGEFELPADLTKQRESLLKAGKTESDLEKRDADSRSRKSKRTPTKSPFEDDGKSWRYSDKIKVKDNQIESLMPSQTSVIDGSRTGTQIPLSPAKKDSADLEKVHHIERAKIGKPEPSFDEEDSAESTEPSEGEFELPAALNKQRESLLKAGKTESDLEKRDADSRSRKSKRTPTKSPFEDDGKSGRYSDKIKVKDNQIESLMPSQTSLIDGSRTGTQIPLSPAKKDSADLEKVRHIERAKIGKPQPSFDEEDSAESTEPSEGEFELPAALNKQRESLLKAGKTESDLEKRDADSRSRKSKRTPTKSPFEDDAKSWRYSDEIKVNDNQIESLVPSQTSLIDGSRTGPQIPLRPGKKHFAELEEVHHHEGAKIDKPEPSFDEEDSAKSTKPSEGEFELPADLTKQRESLLKAGKTESDLEKRDADSRSRKSKRTPTKSPFEDDAKSWRYSDKIKVKDNQIESLVPSQTSLIDGSRTGPQIPLSPAKKDSVDLEKVHHIERAKIGKPELSFDEEDSAESTEPSEGEFELPADFNKQRESLLKVGKTESDLEKRDADSRSRKSKRTPTKSPFEDDGKSWRYSDKIKVKDNQIESLMPSQTSLIDSSRTGPQIPLSPAKKDSADLEKVHHIERAKIGKPEPSFDEEDSAESTEPSVGEFELPAALNKQRESLLKAGKTESDLENRDADSRSRKSKRTPTKSSFEDDAKSWRYSDKIKVKDNQIESIVPSQTSLIDGSRTGPQIPVSPAKKDSAELEKVHPIERAKIGKPEPSFDEEDSAESTEPSEGEFELPADLNRQRESLLKVGKTESEPEKRDAVSRSHECTRTPSKSSFEDDAKSWRYSDEIKVNDNQIESLVPSQTSLIDGSRTGPQILLRPGKNDSAEWEKMNVGEGAKIHKAEKSFHDYNIKESTEPSEGELPVDLNKQRESLLKAGKIEKEPEERHPDSRSSESTRTPSKSSFEEDAISWSYSDKIKVKDNQIESLASSQTSLIDASRTGPQIPLRPGKKHFAELEKVHHHEGAKIDKPEPSFDEEDSAKSTEPSEGEFELPADLTKQRESLLKAGKTESELEKGDADSRSRKNTRTHSKSSFEDDGKCWRYSDKSKVKDHQIESFVQSQTSIIDGSRTGPQIPLRPFKKELAQLEMYLLEDAKIDKADPSLYEEDSAESTEPIEGEFKLPADLKKQREPLLKARKTESEPGKRDADLRSREYTRTSRKSSFQDDAKSWRYSDKNRANVHQIENFLQPQTSLIYSGRTGPQIQLRPGKKDSAELEKVHHLEDAKIDKSEPSLDEEDSAESTEPSEGESKLPVDLNEQRESLLNAGKIEWKPEKRDADSRSCESTRTPSKSPFEDHAKFRRYSDKIKVKDQQIESFVQSQTDFMDGGRRGLQIPLRPGTKDSAELENVHLLEDAKIDKAEPSSDGVDSAELTETSERNSESSADLQKQSESLPKTGESNRKPGICVADSRSRQTIRTPNKSSFKQVAKSGMDSNKSNVKDIKNERLVPSQIRSVASRRITPQIPLRPGKKDSAAVKKVHPGEGVKIHSAVPSNDDVDSPKSTETSKRDSEPTADLHKQSESLLNAGKSHGKPGIRVADSRSRQTTRTPNKSSFKQGAKSGMDSDKSKVKDNKIEGLVPSQIRSIAGRRITPQIPLRPEMMNSAEVKKVYPGEGVKIHKAEPSSDGVDSAESTETSERDSELSAGLHKRSESLLNADKSYGKPGIRVADSRSRQTTRTPNKSSFKKDAKSGMDCDKSIVKDNKIERLVPSKARSPVSHRIAPQIPLRPGMKDSAEVKKVHPGEGVNVHKAEPSNDGVDSAESTETSERYSESSSDLHKQSESLLKAGKSYGKPGIRGADSRSRQTTRTPNKFSYKQCAKSRMDSNKSKAKDLKIERLVPSQIRSVAGRRVTPQIPLRPGMKDSAAVKKLHPGEGVKINKAESSSDGVDSAEFTVTSERCSESSVDLHKQSESLLKTGGSYEKPGIRVADSRSRQTTRAPNKSSLKQAAKSGMDSDKSKVKENKIERLVPSQVRSAVGHRIAPQIPRRPEMKDSAEVKKDHPGEGVKVHKAEPWSDGVDSSESTETSERYSESPGDLHKQRGSLLNADKSYGKPGIRGGDSRRRQTTRAPNKSSFKQDAKSGMDSNKSKAKDLKIERLVPSQIRSVASRRITPQIPLRSGMKDSAEVKKVYAGEGVKIHKAEPSSDGVDSGESTETSERDSESPGDLHKQSGSLLNADKSYGKPGIRGGDSRSRQTTRAPNKSSFKQDAKSDMDSNKDKAKDLKIERLVPSQIRSVAGRRITPQIPLRPGMKDSAEVKKVYAGEGVKIHKAEPSSDGVDSAESTETSERYSESPGDLHKQSGSLLNADKSYGKPGIRGGDSRSRQTTRAPNKSSFKQDAKSDMDSNKDKAKDLKIERLVPSQIRSVAGRRITPQIPLRPGMKDSAEVKKVYAGEGVKIHKAEPSSDGVDSGESTETSERDSEYSKQLSKPMEQFLKASKISNISRKILHAYASPLRKAAHSKFTRESPYFFDSDERCIAESRLVSGGNVEFGPCDSGKNSFTDEMKFLDDGSLLASNCYGGSGFDDFRGSFNCCSRPLSDATGEYYLDGGIFCRENSELVKNEVNDEIKRRTVIENQGQHETLHDENSHCVMDGAFQRSSEDDRLLLDSYNNPKEIYSKNTDSQFCLDRSMGTVYDTSRRIYTLEIQRSSEWRECFDGENQNGGGNDFL